MIPLAFVLALAAATLVVLVVAAIALARELRRLGSTLARFEQETRPHLERIQHDAGRAAARLERLTATGPDERRRPAPAERAPDRGPER